MNLYRAQNAYANSKPMSLLHINSCGYFVEVKDSLGTWRPHGLGDYQLICITDGKMLVKHEGQEFMCGQGTVLLYYPGEEQKYMVSLEHPASYCWVHFDGSAVSELLDSCGIGKLRKYESPAVNEVIHIFKKMITVLERQQPHYQVKLMSYFTDLLVRLSPHTDRRQKALADKLSPALTMMEQDLTTNYSVDDYAAMSRMSPHYFMHCFKAYIGKAPMQYREDILMDHAVYLLENTALSVGEIAGQLGMEDSLYFSRKFKKYFGVSPSVYRKAF